MIRNVVSDDEEPLDQENTPQTKRVKGWSRLHITIEPIKLSLGFSIAFTSGVTIDMLQRNICHSNYNLTLAQCMGNESSDIKASVEGLTAEVSMLNQVTQAFFSLFLVLFIGPWSDANGRKPFILFPLLGYSVYYLCWAVMSFFPSIPVMYMFIASIPLGLSGGMVAIFVCTWSYTCDNFEPENRPIRFSVSSSMLVSGSLLGNALSGQIVNLGGDYGYQIVFGTSFIITTCSFFYTLLVLEETVQRQQGSVRTKLFELENVKNMFMVMLIRPVKGRLLSAIIMTILLTEISFVAGDDAIIYMVGKTQYSWTLNDYNLITAISSVASAISPVFFTWLLGKVCQMTNITVAIISSTIFAITELLKALSVNQIMFWISAIAVKMGMFGGACMDTELSNMVGESDMGKAFTMMSVCDALAPLLAVPLYTLVYKLFLPSHTLYVFFISSVMAVVALTATVGLYFKKMSTSYTRHYDTVESQ